MYVEGRGRGQFYDIILTFSWKIMENCKGPGARIELATF